MKQEKLRDKDPKANFFSDVSQDVSQLNITVIHRLWNFPHLSICLNCMICPLCFHGRYRADDPGRGLPGIGYFQTNALAAKKNRPVGSSICAFFPEVFKSLGHALYRKGPEGSYQSSAYARSKTGAEIND